MRRPTVFGVGNVAAGVALLAGCGGSSGGATLNEPARQSHEVMYQVSVGGPPSASDSLHVSYLDGSGAQQAADVTPAYLGWATTLTSPADAFMLTLGATVRVTDFSRQYTTSCVIYLDGVKAAESSSSAYSCLAQVDLTTYTPPPTPTGSPTPSASPSVAPAPATTTPAAKPSPRKTPTTCRYITPTELAKLTGLDVTGWSDVMGGCWYYIDYSTVHRISLSVLPGYYPPQSDDVSKGTVGGYKAWWNEDSETLILQIGVKVLYVSLDYVDLDGELALAKKIAKTAAPRIARS